MHLGEETTCHNARLDPISFRHMNGYSGHIYKFTKLGLETSKLPVR